MATEGTKPGNRDLKKGRAHLCSCTFGILAINAAFKCARETVHSKMGGDTKRSVYHSEYCIGISPKYLFISCPSSYPLFLIPTMNIHYRNFNKISRLLNCNHIKAIHSNHDNCQLTSLALAKFFQMAYCGKS